jgi:hypothetical protein
VPTYAQIAAWKNASSSIDAATVAVVTYARFILGEDPAVAGHAARVNWAKNAFQNPQGAASGLLMAVASDGNIQATLPTPGPSDAQIQSALEFAVNTVLNF